MKLLFLNYEYPPVGSGGGVISKYMAEGLAALGHEIICITAHFPGLSEEEYLNGVRLIRVKSKREKLHQSHPFEMLDWIEKTKLYIDNHLDNSDFELVIAHFVRPGGDVALYLKEQYNKPYCIISHGHDIPWVHPRQMFFFHLLSYFTIDKILSESRLLLVQSEMMAANAKKFFSPSSRKRIVTIGNGFNPLLFRIPEKKLEKFTLFFSGRMVIQKDPFTLLKALKIISIQLHDAEIHLVGDGPLKVDLQKFTQEHLSHLSIIFHGKIEQSVYAELLAKAHVYAQPSLNEGMCLSVIEAVASACKVIVTPSSGMKEIVFHESFGSFVPFKNANALANEILKYKKEFLNLSSLNVHREQLEIFREKFSWQTQVAAYNDVLKSM